MLSPALQRRDGRNDEEEGWRYSVEEDGVRVPVGYLRHVLQYVFFCDDSQQPPNGKERQEKKKRTSHKTSYHTSSWKVKDRKQRRTVEV